MNQTQALLELAACVAALRANVTPRNRFGKPLVDRVTAERITRLLRAVRGGVLPADMPRGGGEDALDQLGMIAGAILNSPDGFADPLAQAAVAQRDA